VLSSSFFVEWFFCALIEINCRICTSIFSSLLLHRTSLLLCRFLDAGNNETLRTLSEPASKKRQGTKSRAVGRWLAASAMGIMCRCRARWWAGGEHDATCMSARAGGRESAEGISAGAWSASTGDRRTDGCDWVERDRRRRGASASERESRNAHRRSGS
jgi:hypothetical protein